MFESDIQLKGRQSKESEKNLTECVRNRNHPTYTRKTQGREATEEPGGRGERKGRRKGRERERK